MSAVPPSRTVATTLPALMLEQLRRVAALEDRSLAAVIRRAVAFYLAASVPPALERDDVVLELRRRGLGYRRIADELGVNRDAARDLVRRVERRAGFSSPAPPPPEYPKAIPARSPDPETK